MAEHNLRYTARLSRGAPGAPPPPRSAPTHLTPPPALPAALDQKLEGYQQQVQANTEAVTKSQEQVLTQLSKLQDGARPRPPAPPLLHSCCCRPGREPERLAPPLRPLPLMLLPPLQPPLPGLDAILQLKPVQVTKEQAQHVQQINALVAALQQKLGAIDRRMQRVQVGAAASTAAAVLAAAARVRCHGEVPDVLAAPAVSCVLLPAPCCRLTWRGRREALASLRQICDAFFGHSSGAGSMRRSHHSWFFTHVGEGAAAGIASAACRAPRPAQVQPVSTIKPQLNERCNSRPWMRSRCRRHVRCPHQPTGTHTVARRGSASPFASTHVPAPLAREGTCGPASFLTCLMSSQRELSPLAAFGAQLRRSPVLCIPHGIYTNGISTRVRRAVTA
jgi:hypothetical protein